MRATFIFRVIRIIFCLSLSIPMGCVQSPNIVDNRTAGTGVIKQGPGGQIKEATVSFGCTEPAPAHYSEAFHNTIETQLHLTTMEPAKVSSEFSKNLSILSNPLTEQTDLKSILFYICQISSNRGFSESTTKSLIEMAWSARSFPSAEFSRIEQEARQHLQQGYYTMALNESTDLTRINPKYATGFKLKGHAHFMLGEYKSALEAFQAALGVDPNLTSAAFGKGAALLELRDFVQARKIYENLFERSPSDAFVRFNLALSCLMLGEYVTSKEHFLQIYKNEHEYLKAQAALGVGLSEMLAANHNSEEWRGYFKKAICIDPRMRGVLEGTAGKVQGENYALFISLLQKVHNTSSFKSFLGKVRMNSEC